MSETFSAGNATLIVVEAALGMRDAGVLLDIVFTGLPALAVSLESCTFLFVIIEMKKLKKNRKKVF